MRVLFLEPFYGGSHRAFLSTLIPGLREGYGVESSLVTLPGRFWKWRMRGAALWCAERDAEVLRAPYDVVFAGSFTPLAEFVGLFPNLARAGRILYFHENQLSYPLQEEGDASRDRSYGFTQMISAAAATHCVFNSAFNRDSFLTTGDEWLRAMPDAVPRRWRADIAARCEVLGLPMDLPDLDRPARDRGAEAGDPRGPVLLWNHRHEFDKNPEEFFVGLRALARAGVPFRLIVCGEEFRKEPAVFGQAREEFAAQTVHWGFAKNPAVYRELLGQVDFAVSTAQHEFFGLAMLEAVAHGAWPLVPDRLSYRELFPEVCRYREFGPALHNACTRWLAGDPGPDLDVRVIAAPFAKERMLPRYHELLLRAARESANG